MAHGLITEREAKANELSPSPKNGAGSKRTTDGEPTTATNSQSRLASLISVVRLTPHTTATKG